MQVKVPKHRAGVVVAPMPVARTQSRPEPKPPPPALHAQRIVTADPDECAQRMRALGMRVRHNQMSPGPYSAAVVTVPVPDVRISLTSYGSVIASQGSPPAGTYALALPVSPAAGAFLDHHPLRPGTIGLVRPGREFHLLRPARFECVMVFPAADAMDRLSDAALGRPLPQLLGGGPLAAVGDDALATTARHIAQLCTGWTQVEKQFPDDAAVHEGAVRLGHQIIDALLGMVRAPEPVIGWSARQRVVRAAWELVEDSDDIVTVCGLCLRLGVPIRTLDDAFRACLGMAPKRFILGMRLNKVRRLLTRPDDATSVTGAATQLGFFHFGHFARHYVGLFGERPSLTLRRARS